MSAAGVQARPPARPLADRMRPRDLGDWVGQQELLGRGKPLRRALEGGGLHSMVLWGPPGCGKTTLARLLADAGDHHFIGLSAVMAGVKEVRGAMETARRIAETENRATVLFLDEVHRFSKAQQDAFLPFVEDGTVIFIGATTENPAFELNNALLSRARVYAFRGLTEPELMALVDKALRDPNRGLGELALSIDAPARQSLARAADGDARRALNYLETCANLCEVGGHIDDAVIEQAVGKGVRRFDKGGDAFYDQISALHKSIRGSDPNASLYWLARMLDGGCDPLYLARRLVRIASEDVGNADPRALRLALDAWDVQSRLGSPEGELALGQAAVYLACAPKSDAVYRAFNSAREEVRQGGSLPVPSHLRNAPTHLARRMGNGRDYHYPHDFPDGYVPNERYFPEDMAARQYYQPPARGLEARIAERLAELRRQDQAQKDERR